MSNIVGCARRQHGVVEITINRLDHARGTRADHHHDAREGHAGPPERAAEDAVARPVPDPRPHRSGPASAPARHTTCTTRGRRTAPKAAAASSSPRIATSASRKPGAAADARLPVHACSRFRSTRTARAKARWRSPRRSTSTRARTPSSWKTTPASPCACRTSRSSLPEIGQSRLPRCLATSSGTACSSPSRSRITICFRSSRWGWRSSS